MLKQIFVARFQSVCYNFDNKRILFAYNKDTMINKELLKIGKLLARQDQDKREIRIYLNPENKDKDYHNLIKQQEEQENGK